MNQSLCRYILTFAAMIMVAFNVNGQATMPKELTENTIEEQIKFLEGRTKIYEDYRAIREDMFQKINRNVIDTLSSGKNKIAELDYLASVLTRSNDSLKVILETTRENLKETTTTKNQIRLFGMEINKITYNVIMWTIITGLVVLLTIGFLVFKSNFSVKNRTEKELKELKDEFEAYRQSSRIAREKMAMDHFNEIKKLKGT
jgi:hypothetical protein